MKKYIFTIIVIILTLAYTGCSKNAKNEDETNEIITDQEVSENEATPTTTEKSSENELIMLEELENIRDAVAGEYDAYIPNVAYNATQMQELFGIDESWYDVFLAESSEMSEQVNVFVAIHPINGNLDNVKAALESYKDYLVNNSYQDPMNTIKVNAASIEVIGEYVYFIMLGQVDDNIYDEAEVLKKYEEQNQIAIYTINEYIR